MATPFYKFEILGPTLEILNKEFTFLGSAPDNELENSWDRILYFCFEIANAIYPEYLSLLDDIVRLITLVSEDEIDSALDLLGEMYSRGYADIADFELSRAD